MAHRLAITVEDAPGDASGPRHSKTNVLDLLVVGNGNRDAPTLVTTLAIFGGCKSAPDFRRSHAPVSGAHLFEGKPSVGAGRRGHAFPTGPAALGFAHLNDGPADR